MGSVFWPKAEFVSPAGIVSLATASFGQRFTVTPIQLITALSACINGGHLMEPYLVQSVTDTEGNVVSYHEPTEIRQVVSQETSDLVRSFMESVVSGRNGTGKNAYVPGYRIGGKTGSSQTLTKDPETGRERIIVSFAGFAPADDPEVIVLLGYDWPWSATPESNSTASGVYISGGNMAAPMAGELIANILDYLGHQKSKQHNSPRHIHGAPKEHHENIHRDHGLYGIFTQQRPNEHLHGIYLNAIGCHKADAEGLLANRLPVFQPQRDCKLQKQNCQQNAHRGNDQRKVDYHVVILQHLLIMDQCLVGRIIVCFCLSFQLLVSLGSNGKLHAVLGLIAVIAGQKRIVVAVKI